MEPDVVQDSAFTPYTAQEFSRQGMRLRAVARALLLALTVLLPLWVLPFTSFPTTLNKAYIAYVLVIVAGILWIVAAVREGRMRMFWHPFFAALAGLVVATGAALVFSRMRSVSFFGVGNEVGTFAAILLYAFGAFFAAMLFREMRAVARWFAALFIAALAVFVLQFFWSGLGVQLLPFMTFANKATTVVGGWNALGGFFGFTALVALVYWTLGEAGRLRQLAFVAMLASLVGMAFVNFTIGWWVFAAFVAVLLVYRFVSQRNPQLLVSAPFFVLLLALLFLLAGDAIGGVLNSLNIVNVEVRPSWASTLAVGREALKHNPVFGSGPDAFLYDWLRFRPVSVNQTPFWDARFTLGVGTIPSLAFETGILGIIGWVAVLAFFLWTGLRAITRALVAVRPEETAFPLAAAFGSAYLWALAVVYAAPFFLVFLAFLSTGVLFAALAAQKTGKTIDLAFMQNTAVGFVSALTALFLIIIGLASIYFLGRAYAASGFFASGLGAFNNAGNAELARSRFERARQLDDKDIYNRALTELDLAELVRLIQAGNFSTDQARSQLQAQLSRTITSANRAKDANPIDPQNWMLLGRVYETVLPLGIGGADQFAARSYEQAAALTPNDPQPRIALARVAFAQNNRSRARELLEEAVGLKGDFAPAQFLLAQVAVQEGNLREAIQRTQSTALLAPNDIGVLFQLGLLYYQNNDMVSSQQVFERLVAQSPNYSNARYFLGLAYDRQGRRAEATMQFVEIEKLNPDNAEVKRILQNLNVGRPALFGIAPPPENRPAPPVSGE